MTKIAEFANSVDLDEVAHTEPPHLDLHYLPSSLWILNMIWLGLNIFWKFADENFVVCLSVVKELKDYLEQATETHDHRDSKYQGPAVQNQRSRLLTRC